jgi:hypothetical protein
MRHLLRLTLPGLLLLSVIIVHAQDELCTAKGGLIDAATGECILFESAETYEISIAYPVELVEDYPFTEATVDGYLESARTNFQQIIDETPTETLPGPLLMRITYEIFPYFESFVGIQFRRLEYTGGASPIILVDTFTFDIEDEELVTLSDLFRPGTNYLNVIQPIALQSLRDEYGEGTVFEGGLDPVDSNYRSFVLHNYRLIFTFDEYQVAPGAAGTPSVSIPLYRLENILSPDVIVYRKG